MDVIKKNHKAVDATWPAALSGLQTPIRTLWHALYFPEQRKLQVSFYLGEGPDQEQPNNIRIRRSEYLAFALTSAKAGNEEAGDRADRADRMDRASAQFMKKRKA